MADVNFSDRMWMVRTELPGVAEPTLFYRYSQSVKRFLKESLCWQKSLPSTFPFNTADDFPDISGDLPTGTYVVQPTNIKWSDGAKVPFKTRAQLDAIDSDWEQATAIKPKYWTILSPGEFRLYPKSSVDATNKLYIRVALSIITPTATAIAQEVMDEWEEAFAAGALFNLLKMPGKDWTDTRLAASYNQIFNDNIKSAKSRAGADYGRPDRVIKYGGI